MSQPRHVKVKSEMAFRNISEDEEFFEHLKILMNWVNAKKGFHDGYLHRNLAKNALKDGFDIKNKNLYKQSFRGTRQIIKKIQGFKGFKRNAVSPQLRVKSKLLHM